MPQRYVEINGTRIWTSLQGSGVPLILCHGGPGAYDYLQPVSDMVDDLCTVIRYDQRGSGRSPAAPPYSVAGFVADLDGLRSHYGFESWIVGGHSWGAALALSYAVQFPERTIALAYISGTGIEPTWHDVYSRNRLAALSSSEQVEFLQLRTQCNQVTENNKEQLQQRLRSLSRKTDLADATKVNDLPSFLEYPTSNLVNSVLNADWERYLLCAEFQTAVRRLSMPALFLHGMQDPRTWQFAADLANQVVNGEFHGIAGAGHFPWIEQPDVLRALLRAFIDRLVTKEMPR